MSTHIHAAATARINARLLAASVGVIIAIAPATSAPAGEPASGSTPSKGQPVRRGRVFKQPMVNLEAQALTRRPGQVMPGDPPPEKFVEPAQEPVSPAPASEPSTLELPPPAGGPSSDPSSGTKPRRPVKPAPAPVEPDSGPRPLPRSATNPPPRNDIEASTDTGVLVDGVAPAPVLSSASDPEVSGALPITASRTEELTEPIRVTVVSTAGAGGWEGADVQWRPVGGAWNAAAVAGVLTDPVEIRTGLDGDVVLEIDGRLLVRVHPLSRVTVERRVLGGTGGAPARSMPALALQRGTLDLRRAAETAGPTDCWARTPDRSAGFRAGPGVRIAYNAFVGTSIAYGDASSAP